MTMRAHRLSQLWFCELEIEDLRSAQLEGIRYRVNDFATETFEVFCGDIEVLSCGPA
ncbi:MAG: hypothetical protein R3F14_00025 [Polyangiaceae bacterium]